MVGHPFHSDLFESLIQPVKKGFNKCKGKCKCDSFLLPFKCLHNTGRKSCQNALDVINRMFAGPHWLLEWRSNIFWHPRQLWIKCALILEWWRLKSFVTFLFVTVLHSSCFDWEAVLWIRLIMHIWVFSLCHCTRQRLLYVAVNVGT